MPSYYYIGSALFSAEKRLTHYGIKGMKWGVRRYQNPDGTLTSEGKARYLGNGFSTLGGTYAMVTTYNKKGEDGRKLSRQEQVLARNKAFYEQINAAENTRIDVDRDATRKGSNVDAEQVVDDIFSLLNPVSATIMLTEKAVTGVATAIGKKKVKKMFENRENEPIDEKTGLHKKSQEMDEKADLKMINPEFHNFNSNSKNNCMMCTTAYDLRRRGYDVTAAKDSFGYNFADIKRWYPKAKIQAADGLSPTGMYSNKTLRDNIRKLALDHGEGARGNILVSWGRGTEGSYGGHSMIWEVKNGQFIIRDGQTNKVYNNPDSILKNCNYAALARLDNVEPDWDEIKETIR